MAHPAVAAQHEAFNGQCFGTYRAAPMQPRDGDAHFGADTEFAAVAIERALAEHDSRIALVMLPGVQYRTGHAFDLEGDRHARAPARLRGRLRPRPRRRQPAAGAA
ncbi:hypothetical protein RLIN73S_05442 [Rhodanobacter lindaniclasticus]